MAVDAQFEPLALTGRFFGGNRAADGEAIIKVETSKVRNVERPFVEQTASFGFAHGGGIGLAADKLVDATAAAIIAGVDHHRLPIDQFPITAQGEDGVFPAGATHRS